MKHLRKFLKYASMIAMVEALPIIYAALEGVEGISQIDWATTLDHAALSAVKAVVAGALGVLINLVGDRKHSVIKPVEVK